MRNVRVKGRDSVPVAYGIYADVPDCIVGVEGSGEVRLMALYRRSVARWIKPLPLGRVVTGTRTWERRSKGNRYVNARGQTPEWHGWLPNSRSARPDVTADTRGEVLVRLVARHLHRQGKSRVVSR